MLKLEVIIHDQQWPLITITASRESFERGKVVLQEKKQYDLAYGKAEEMCHNLLRPMVEELVKRHQHQTVVAPK